MPGSSLCPCLTPCGVTIRCGRVPCAAIRSAQPASCAPRSHSPSPPFSLPGFPSRPVSPTLPALSGTSRDGLTTGAGFPHSASLKDPPYALVPPTKGHSCECEWLGIVLYPTVTPVQMPSFDSSVRAYASSRSAKCLLIIRHWGGTHFHNASTLVHCVGNLPQT